MPDGLETFQQGDAALVVEAGRVREVARALVERYGQLAALELAKLRGAKLSRLREHWDRCGLFVFAEP
ncbi:MAG: hypothetical protein ACYCWW_08140, partial [Deltaproteobacteria bacterium]